jgi:hypothetical protein
MSGIPHGQPRGRPNPRRRVPDPAARPLSAQALSDLRDREPNPLLPLAAQLLPPRASIDPAERLGVDLSSLRTVEDFRQVLPTVLAAVAPARSRPPRARASHGGGVPGWAPSGAAHDYNAGWYIKRVRPGCRSDGTPCPVCHHRPSTISGSPLPWIAALRPSRRPLRGLLTG